MSSETRHEEAQVLIPLGSTARAVDNGFARFAAVIENPGIPLPATTLPPPAEMSATKKG